MNRVIKVFGDAVVQAVNKEIKQLHYRKVPIPVDPAKISYGSRSATLKNLMFLKMKRCGLIKGRVCADVWSHMYK